MNTNTKKKKGFKKSSAPHVYILLMVIIIFCASLTYIIPAGNFDRIEDIKTERIIIDSESFELIEGNPQGLFDVLKAIPEGLIQSADIIFFLLIIGGAFEVISKTGFIDAGIKVIVNKFGKNSKWLLPITIIIFSIAGGTIGIAEESIVFIPIFIALCKGLGYDTMVGLAIVSVGARVGFTAGLMNPFTVGVAQGIAELPLYSGLAYRILWYLIILVATIAYIMRYAKKVKEDPKESIMYGLESELEHDHISDLPDFNNRHRLALITTLIAFVILVYGISVYNWYIKQMSAVFLGMGIFTGFAGGLKSEEIANSFVKGAEKLVFGALIVGMARASLVIMQEGNIIDSIIYYVGNSLKGMPRILAANAMYFFQLILNIFIPSGSGQAATTIPIMAPISDYIGITRQTAVLAFHYGDGFTNLISPTNATLMSSIAIANVPYEKWAKWMWPLLIFWILAGMAAVTIATLINYGPF